MIKNNGWGFHLYTRHPHVVLIFGWEQQMDKTNEQTVGWQNSKACVQHPDLHAVAKERCTLVHQRCVYIAPTNTGLLAGLQSAYGHGLESPSSASWAKQIFKMHFTNSCIEAFNSSLWVLILRRTHLIKVYLYIYINMNIYIYINIECKYNIYLYHIYTSHVHE